MRALALLLLLSNALFFAWTQGWLDGVAGVRAHGDREPERLARQVRPDAIRVLSPSAAASAGLDAAAAASAAPAGSAPVGTPAAASAAAAGSSAADATGAASAAAAGGTPSAAGAVRAPLPAPGTAAASARSNPATPVVAAAAPTVTSTEPAASMACLQAGPFAAADLSAAQAALKVAFPALRPVDVAVPRGGGWMVYMGRYADRDAQLRKEDELRRIAVVFEEIGAPPGLGPGLALGRYASRGAAEAALAQFARRGIRTARVVETVPPVTAHLLRVDRLDAASAGALAALRLPPGTERGFGACPDVR